VEGSEITSRLSSPPNYIFPNKYSFHSKNLGRDEEVIVGIIIRRAKEDC
jgi:hypothetical protein